VIPRFVQAALSGEPLEIHGDGSQTRCFCHVRDVVRGLEQLMSASDASGKIYNLGSTEVVTILELAERVLRATGSSSELVFVPYEQVYAHGVEEMFQRVPSTDRIRAELGWEPTVNLDGILEEVISYVSTSSPPPEAARVSP
jgi:UDP-glucose 4-epimerase